ncbi:uncharacterized protein BKA78DRAFT_357912 [Phyllosticta capitalensis]|uniref:uncharacterized protein n=1 Tax=Phyllosticta capitalensis TaxID=121624 RepID=UPI00312E7B39
MRPKTYESLHILLGLSPQASAAEIIPAAERETGKTQHALDTLLRLRSERENPAYESPGMESNSDSHLNSFGSSSQEPTTKTGKTAGEQDTMTQSSNGPNVLQQNVESRGTWKSLRNTLKNRASILFTGKTRSLMSLNFLKSVPKVSPMQSQFPGGTELSLLSNSSPDDFNCKTTPSPRNGLASKDDRQEPMPIICGLLVGDSIVHFNCPPPCRNTSSLTQFPRLPDDAFITDNDSVTEGSVNEGSVNEGSVIEDSSASFKKSLPDKYHVNNHCSVSGAHPVHDHSSIRSDDSSDDEHFVDENGQVIGDFALSDQYSVNEEEVVIGDDPASDDLAEDPSVQEEDIVFDRAMLENIFNRSRRIRPRGTVFGLFSG